MILRDKGKIKYLTFRKLDGLGVKHCFTTRVGGVSCGPYSSMNLGFGRGDEDEKVRENFRKMAEVMEVSYESFCLSQQTHTTNVRVITKADAGNGIIRPLPYTDVDGMITDVPGITLSTFYADCVPLYFYDPVHKAIGLSHSGWRGTVGRIGQKTVRLMAENYGSRPEDIVACVGPSICRNCYEVSGDVAGEFQKAGLQSVIRPSVFNPEDPDKFMLDLWEANRLIFLEAGIREENIEITDYCTRCNPDLFYSHRIMGPVRGNLAAFMSL